MTIMGITFIGNPMCVQTSVRYDVVRCEKQKRRRNWRVVRTVEESPCCYHLPLENKVVCHPSLMDRMKAIYGHQTHST